MSNLYKSGSLIFFEDNAGVLRVRYEVRKYDVTKSTILAYLEYVSKKDYPYDHGFRILDSYNPCELTISFNGSSFGKVLEKEAYYEIKANTETYVNILSIEETIVDDLTDFSFDIYANVTPNSYIYGATGGVTQPLRNSIEATITVPVTERASFITAESFTDEENPSFNYVVNGIENIIKIEAGISVNGNTDVIKYREIPINGTSYSFNLTNAERELLRKEAAGSNSIPVYYLLKTTKETVTSSYSLTEPIEKRLTIIGAEPTLAPTVENIDSITMALTGDNDTFIRYYSKANYAINAYASKGATITHQQVTNGSKISTLPTGTIEGVESGTFLFTVADSRNNIASAVIEKPIVNYVKLTCNIVADNPDTEGKVNFTVKGNYFNDTFGLVNNSLQLAYRIKSNNDEYGEWITLAPTIKDNTYTVSISLTGLNYTSTYTLQAKAIDKLATVTSADTKIKTEPVFDWSESDFNFNVPVTYTEDGKKYYLTDIIKNVNGLDTGGLNKLLGLADLMTTRRDLPCTIYKSSFYSSVDVTLLLYGNIVRGYMKAVRNETLAAGNPSNELVCQVEFDSNNLITGFGTMCFTSGTEGGVATFQMTDTIIYPNDGSVSEDMVGKGAFSITLCATGNASNEWNAYFSFPVLLDLTKV